MRRIIMNLLLPCCRHVPTHGTRRCHTHIAKQRYAARVTKYKHYTRKETRYSYIPTRMPRTKEIFRRRRKDQSCRSGKGKNILVTGGTGSFGNAFITALVTMFEPNKVIVYSRDELKQSLMLKKFHPRSTLSCAFCLRRARRFPLETSLPWRSYRRPRGCVKQVPALEYNPTEAIKTNIMGAMNIIEACHECGVEQLVALSTDKAAAPINLYGATKLCSDKLFVAGNSVSGKDGCKFSVVRYGNVFGSRGSIVPVLHKLRPTGKVGLTDVRMTRFNISLDDAVNFVLSGFAIQQGGEIFIPKLPSYKLPVIAQGVCPEMWYPS